MARSPPLGQAKNPRERLNWRFSTQINSRATPRFGARNQRVGLTRALNAAGMRLTVCGSFQLSKNGSVVAVEPYHRTSPLILAPRTPGGRSATPLVGPA